MGEGRVAAQACLTTLVSLRSGCRRQTLVRSRDPETRSTTLASLVLGAGGNPDAGCRLWSMLWSRALSPSSTL
eukprot:298703-Amphidinium_carterae.1